MITYITGQKHYNVKTMLSDKYEEVKYWQNGLSIVVSVVQFLARRDNQTSRSASNGLHLGCLDLISEYDCFLVQHIKEYGDKGLGHIFYLSANTCNELHYISLHYICEDRRFCWQP